mgnify:CR=1 FL=1
MPITPIDLQTNMNQSIEVARTQKAHDLAMIEQQQFLDKETEDKAVTIDSALEHNEEAKSLEKTDEEGQRGGKKKARGKRNKTGYEQKPETKTEFVEDYRVGGIIDIRK